MGHADGGQVEIAVGDVVRDNQRSVQKMRKRNRIHQADSLVVELPKSRLKSHISAAGIAVGCTVFRAQSWPECDGAGQGRGRKRSVGAALDDEQHDVVVGCTAAASLELR